MNLQSKNNRFRHKKKTHPIFVTLAVVEALNFGITFFPTLYLTVKSN